MLQFFLCFLTYTFIGRSYDLVMIAQSILNLSGFLNFIVYGRLLIPQEKERTVSIRSEQVAESLLFDVSITADYERQNEESLPLSVHSRRETFV